MASFRSLLGQLSGSEAGRVYSRNRFGPYLRNRSVPVNPNSTGQQAARAALTAATTAWRGLTEAQRIDWRAHAETSPRANRLGETTFLTGHQQFTGSYALAVAVGVTPPDDAPADPGAAPALPAPNATTGSEEVTISTVGAASVDLVVLDTNSGSELQGVGGGILVQYGLPLSDGVQFFNGPWRRAGVYAFGAGAPPAMTAIDWTVPSVGAAGQRVPIRWRYLAPDGRRSPWSQAVVESA